MFKKGVRINWLIVVGAFFILLPSVFKLTLAKPDYIFAASPAMQDPNFEETVLYMMHHTVDGASAIVLNRPYPLNRKKDLPAFLQKDNLSVFWGGPIGDRDVVYILKYSGQQDKPMLRSFDEWMAGHKDILGEIEKSPQSYRIYVGAAGWGPLQFELERMAGAWFFGVKKKMILDIPVSQVGAMWHEFMKEAPQNHKSAIARARVS